MYFKRTFLFVTVDVAAYDDDEWTRLNPSRSFAKDKEKVQSLSQEP